MANISKRTATSVEISSNKNNPINRAAKQSKVLDDVVFDKVKKTVFASINRGTSKARKDIDRMKTTIVSNNRKVQSKAASLSQAIPTDGSVEENLLDLINRGVFFALAPENSAESSSSTKQREFKSLLKAGLDLVGRRENSPLVRISRVADSKYREIILEEDDEFESDDNKFFQLISATPLDASNAEALAISFIENYVIAWDGESTIFGTLKPLKVYEEMSPNDRKFALSQPFTSYVLIRHETSSYAEYHHMAVAVKINEEGNIIESSIKKTKRGQEVGAKAEIARYDAEKLDKNITRAILEAEKVSRQEGISILEYGHLISAGTVALMEVASDLEVFLSSIDPSLSSNQFVNKLRNLQITLTNIIQVSNKLDGIIESWGTVAGPDVMGLDYKDILAVLGSSEAFNPGEIYIYEKVNGLTVRKGSVTRNAVIEVEMADGTLQTTTGPLVGVMERARFNNAKGAITRALINILKKELEGDLEKALTTSDVLERIGATGTQTTASDSILSATVKQIFDEPIDKGKPRNTTIVIKTKAQKLGKSVQNLASIKAGRRIARDKAKKTSSMPSGVGDKSILTSSSNLAARVNAILRDELIQEMNPPRLQNRTGRFASSAEVLSVEDGLVTYRYMYYPYSVFSKADGRAPWNSVGDRDPDKLIITVVNRLLRSYTENLNFTFTRG